jgi:hypothetical protein
MFVVNERNENLQTLTPALSLLKGRGRRFRIKCEKNRILKSEEFCDDFLQMSFDIAATCSSPTRAKWKMLFVKKGAKEPDF